MIDPLTESQAMYRRELEIAAGYPLVVLLESGEWAALGRLMATTALLVGINRWEYRTRFCYPRPDLAVQALIAWDGRGDPPGAWLKEKGRTIDGQLVDRLNPHVCNCEFGREVCSKHAIRARRAVC